jgi:hypothetical protein
LRKFTGVADEHHHQLERAWAPTSAALRRLVELLFGRQRLGRGSDASTSDTQGVAGPRWRTLVAVGGEVLDYLVAGNRYDRDKTEKDDFHCDDSMRF